MKKFAFKLLLFASLFLMYDKLFIIVANRSAEAEVDKSLEYLVKGEINKDIIMIGSSRGSRAIIAEQIEKKTGFSAYNLCYPGSTVEFHEFILRTLLKFNDPPKLIFFVIDDDIYFLHDEARTIIFRKDRLYPLVKYPYIREELINQGEKDKFLSKFLILHQLNKANFDIRKKRFTPIDTIMNCGSMPITWQKKGIDWQNGTDERVYTRDNEVAEKVDAYREIIKTCNLNNIELVIVFPPLHRTHSISFENRMRELSDDKVHFYIYNTENQIYRNKDYFHDRGHLMRKGAEIFTSELVDYLNDSFKDILAN